MHLETDTILIFNESRFEASFLYFSKKSTVVFGFLG